jgi:hypothetical protein
MTEKQTDTPADPRCPSCDVRGIEKIVSRPSEQTSKSDKPWFFIAQCTDCGHIYGVFTKHTFGPPGGPQLVIKERGN